VRPDEERLDLVTVAADHSCLLHATIPHAGDLIGQDNGRVPLWASGDPVG
jgi:hypothetical protein